MRVVFLAVLLGGCSVRFFEVETLAGAEVVTSLFPRSGPPGSPGACLRPGVQRARRPACVRVRGAR
jgi:hypothetical protein